MPNCDACSERQIQVGSKRNCQVGRISSCNTRRTNLFSEHILLQKKGWSLIYRNSLDPSFDAEKTMTPPVDQLSEPFTTASRVKLEGGQHEGWSATTFSNTAPAASSRTITALQIMANYVRDLVFEDGARPYCGAGLFVISLSSGFEKVLGIEFPKFQSPPRGAMHSFTSSDKISSLSGGASNIFTTVKAFPQE